jgi:hypothetical protein
MMAAFEVPFHGIQFAISDGSCYVTEDTLSWGANPTYTQSIANGNSTHSPAITNRKMGPAHSMCARE